MAGPWEPLAVTSIRGIWREIRDIRQLSGAQMDFRWTKGTDGRLGNVKLSKSPRFPMKNVLPGEVFARMSDRVSIAPIVGHGQQAPLRVPNLTVRLQQVAIPKIKHGESVDEEKLLMLSRVKDNLSRTLEEVYTEEDGYREFMNYEVERLQMLSLGVDARVEWMAVQSLLGTLTYANDKGAIFQMTWDMPADLKVNVNPWGSGNFGIQEAVPTATPATDIQSLQTNTQQKYGTRFNRMSISMKGFLYILGTTEFQKLAPVYMQAHGIAPNVAQIPTSDFAFMKSIVQDMFGMEIEIDDRVYQTETNNLTNWAAPPAAPASGQFSRFMPENKVILSRSEDDGDMSVWDIGNTYVYEGLPGMVPGLIGNFEGGGGMYGPISYATAASLNANPPGMELWTAQAAVPRRKEITNTAVLTIF